MGSYGPQLEGGHSKVFGGIMQSLKRGYWLALLHVGRIMCGFV